MKYSQKHNYSRFKFLLFVLLIFGLTDGSFAQNSPGKSDDEKRKVQLNIAVADRYGRYIEGFDKNDFRVLADGKEQKIISVEFEDQPMSIGILVDVSASMEKQMDKVRYGLVEFINNSHPENEYFLVLFNDRTRQILDFTQDPKELFEKIKSLSEVEPKENTAVYNAIDYGINKLINAKFDKRALLLFSDGQENESESKYKHIRKAFERNDVLLYLAGVGEYSLTSPIVFKARDYMYRLTSQTGGNAFYPKDITEIKEILQRIGLELQNQYKITFYLDKETYQKAKKDNDPVKIKVKSNRFIYKDDKGKEQNIKTYPRFRRKIFLQN